MWRVCSSSKISIPIAIQNSLKLQKFIISSDFTIKLAEKVGQLWKVALRGEKPSLMMQRKLNCLGLRIAKDSGDGDSDMMKEGKEKGSNQNCQLEFGNRISISRWPWRSEARKRNYLRAEEFHQRKSEAIK